MAMAKHPVLQASKNCIECNICKVTFPCRHHLDIFFFSNVSTHTHTHTHTHGCLICMCIITNIPCIELAMLLFVAKSQLPDTVSNFSHLQPPQFINQHWHCAKRTYSLTSLM